MIESSDFREHLKEHMQPGALEKTQSGSGTLEKQSSQGSRRRRTERGGKNELSKNYSTESAEEAKSPKVQEPSIQERSIEEESISVKGNSKAAQEVKQNLSYKVDSAKKPSSQKKEAESPGSTGSGHVLVPELVMKEFQLAIGERQIDVEHETTEHIANKQYSDVLLIVTGGTFCMV